MILWIGCFVWFLNVSMPETYSKSFLNWFLFIDRLSMSWFSLASPPAPPDPNSSMILLVVFIVSFYDSSMVTGTDSPLWDSSSKKLPSPDSGLGLRFLITGLVPQLSWFFWSSLTVSLSYKSSKSLELLVESKTLTLPTTSRFWSDRPLKVSVP